MEKKNHKESRIRESEEQFRLMFLQAPIGAAVVSLDFRFLQVNDALCRITGYTTVELTSLTFPDITYPDDLVLDVKQAQQLAAGEIDYYTMEKRCIRKDGTIVWVQFSTGIVKDAEGRPFYYLLMIEDITERKIASEMLNTSENRYRTLTESSPDQIFIIGRDDTIQFANTASLKLFNHTLDQIIGRPRKTLFPPGIADAQSILLNKVFKTGEIVHQEEKIQFGTQEFWIDTSLIPLKDTTGTVTSALGISRNITERKRIEDEIALKNIILSTQQETSPDGILVVDETAKIISYNQRFIDLWEIPDNVIASRNDKQVLLSVQKKLEKPGEFLARLKYLHEHPDEKSQEEIFLVDGRVLDRFSAPMYRKDGRYLGRVWYFRDITNQKQAEQKILTLNQDLERRVEERTRELQQINEKLCITNEELTATEQELRVQVEVTNEAYDALEKSEERSRCLYESDLIGIAFAGMEKIEDSNDTFLAMVGYSRDDLKRGLISWQKLFPPEWAVADARGFEELQSHGSCIPYEKEFYRKDGSRVSVLFGSALFENNPITSVCFIQDISERKRTEEKILKISDDFQLARDYSQSIVDTVREPLVVLNSSFEVISASRAFYTTFEVSPEATLGKVLYTLGDNQWDIPQLHEMLETVLPESTSFDNFEIEHDFPGIGHRNMLLNARRILSETGTTELILLVIEDISERKKMSEQIIVSLAEKETLLREIHHRVKNNLQIIISLLNLQIRRMNDPGTIETLKDSQNRVRSMALVHEHLYKGKDISHINLGNYLKALGTGLFQSYEDGRRGIRFDINIRDIYVDINIAIPLGLISNELIINSLKYAFSEKTGGILSLTATEDLETLHFIVADNGIGIPEGITLENQDSMGLRLVNMFTDQLNATVVIDRTEGTKFIFAIPKPRE